MPLVGAGQHGIEISEPAGGRILHAVNETRAVAILIGKILFECFAGIVVADQELQRRFQCRE